MILPLACAILLAGCGLIDVDNPNITEDSYINTSMASQSWVVGMNREVALMMNQVVVNTELVSDNYFNNRTENSKVFDIPKIDYFDPDLNSVQAAIHRVREMAEFGLNKVVPNDAATTSDQMAVLYFYKGFAHTLSGELFTALPGTAGGEVLTPAQHFELAIDNFREAQSRYTAQKDKLICELMLARAFYFSGNRSEAVTHAAAALADPSLIRQVQYDGTNSVLNSMQTDIFSSSFNEFAPLPRLDFVDPKYYHVASAVTDQKPLALVKAEEAWFIIAEAQLAANDLNSARQTLKDLLTKTVSVRPVNAINGSNQKRAGGNRKDYPLKADVQVRFDESSAPLDGYILDRQAGNIPVYLSYTKVTSVEIDNAGNQADLLYLLYRMRQEIFIAEGRRMTDLGIRFPISQTEALNNAHVKPEHTQAQIPVFIPLDKRMDDFTYDVAQKMVVMRFDMNRVLVNNRAAREIFPFID